MKNLALLSSIVNTCLKDVLMDDISNPEIAIIGNAHRNINLLGGDYGVDSKKTHMTFHKSTASHDGYISIIPTLLQTQTHPNFFFSKLNKDSHFDLRGYSALHFNLKVHDLKDSADSYDASVCLTQKSNDGKEIVHGMDLNEFKIYSRW